MTEQAPDDVFALFSRFELDERNYRVFAKPVPVAALSEPVTAPRSRDAQSDHFAESPSFNRQERTDFSEKRPVKQELPEEDHGRRALRHLSQHLASASIRSSASSAADLAARSISILGAAGGVGTTTVAVILTRLLVKSGRRCGLLDETGDSALPIFFGGQRVAEQHRRYSGLHALFEPGVRIFRLDGFDLEKPISADDPSFIERNFADSAGQFDHLILDHRSRSGRDLGAKLRVIVAVPDLSSLAGMGSLIAKPNTDTARTICILNRFDSTSTLHQEILGWYRETFQDVFIVRESPIVSEALVEGTTVVDFVPDSAVASDFTKIFVFARQQLFPE